MTPIALHFEPEFDEYLHGMRLYDSKELASPRSMIKLMLACALLSLMLYWQCGQWPYLLVGPGLFAIIRLAIFNARPSQCRAIYKSKLAQGPFDVTFDEAGMVSQSRDGKAELKWQTFQKIIESDRVFLLVYSKYGYVTIPKRVFESPAQIDEFRELVTSKISQDSGE